MKQETSLASSLTAEAEQELQTNVITAPEGRNAKTINIHPQCIHSHQEWSIKIDSGHNKRQRQQ
jgi:hypothetical protein